MTLLSQEFKQYSKAMAKINVYGSTLDTLDTKEYKITLIENRYTRNDQKLFSRNPQEVTTKTITARQYACYITSIGFFKDRVYKNYTPVGYIPTRLTCINPDRTLKIVRTFKIDYNETK